jgi:hypothetical protein
MTQMFGASITLIFITVDCNVFPRSLPKIIIIDSGIPNNRHIPVLDLSKGLTF